MLKPNSQQNIQGINSIDAPLVDNARFDGEAVATVAPTDADCAFVEANLYAYLDAELAPRPHNAVALHLDNCPDCANKAKAATRAEQFLRGEWSREASLPSPCEIQIALDSIMDALPPQPETPKHPRLLHTTLAWVRFSTGIVGFMLFLGLLWSSYQVGYANGVSHALSSGSIGSDNHTLHPLPTSSPSEPPTPSPSPPPNNKPRLKLI